MPLVLAGKANQKDEWHYLDEVIRPALGPDVELVLNGEREQTDALLLEARALILPIRWEEPFGMVLIEAMSKGTPVVALRRGAVPEVVLHGRTGMICDDEADLPDALHEVSSLDPTEIAEHVRTSFSVPLMASRYERVYRRILSRLYSGEVDALEVLRVKDIVSALEGAMNTIEDISDVVEAIVLKHA